MQSAANILVQGMENNPVATGGTVVVPLVAALLSIGGSWLVAYCTARYAIHSQSRHGRLLMLGLVRRFAINFVNAHDFNTNRYKDDSMSKAKYVAELTAILDELQRLAVNPWYSELIERYPETSTLLVQCRFELVEHRETSSFALNEGTLRGFWNLYQVLKKDSARMPNAAIDDEFEKLARGYNLPDSK